ncbi:MAG: SDR family oxidoreductase [Alphaproteobacteria bacterium]|nr:SDR family oxidoreductase [Alphaproteobacteria bacterium]MBL6946054.1 SDR family oxidoreductase [Rhodospirillales bacterium]
MNKIDLNGRAAIVTGAAMGIGYATAERFLESGASVSLWDINAEALEKAAGALAKKGEVQTVLVDCSSEAGIAAAYEQTTARFPVVDILVVNAGVRGINKTCLEFTLDDWNHLMRNDLTSVFLTCRAAVPAMVERGYGRVVIVSSIAGAEGAPNNGAYAAAKGGSITYAKTLGKELANTGVLVNCNIPSGIDTPFLKGLTKEYMASVTSKMPIGRMGAAEEVAAQIAWLASEENSFSAGAVFDLSGGRAVY